MPVFFKYMNIPVCFMSKTNANISGILPGRFGKDEVVGDNSWGNGRPDVMNELFHLPIVEVHRPDNGDG